MSDERRETVAEIVADIRERADNAIVPSGAGFRVSCTGCLALGPYANEIHRAIDEWNRRACDE